MWEWWSHILHSVETSNCVDLSFITDVSLAWLGFSPSQLTQIDLSVLNPQSINWTVLIWALISSVLLNCTVSHLNTNASLLNRVVSHFNTYVSLLHCVVSSFNTDASLLNSWSFLSQLNWVVLCFDTNLSLLNCVVSHLNTTGYSIIYIYIYYIIIYSITTDRLNSKSILHLINSYVT